MHAMLFAAAHAPRRHSAPSQPLALPRSPPRWTPAAFAQEAKTSHGLSLYGELKYPPDFKHYDYVNPDAPKGGTVKYDAIGTFDTLNPFTLKGVKAAGNGRASSTR